MCHLVQGVTSGLTKLQPQTRAMFSETEKTDRVMSVSTHLRGLIRAHPLRLASFEDMGMQHHDPEETRTPFADACPHRRSELPGHSSPQERLYLRDPRAHLDIWTPVTGTPCLQLKVRAWCRRVLSYLFTQLNVTLQYFLQGGGDGDGDCFFDCVFCA